MDQRLLRGADSFERLQQVSQAITGNQDRLLVALAVAEAHPNEIWADNLAQALGIAASRVGPHLARFVDAGILVKLPKVGGDRRVYYQRQGDAFWQAVRALSDELLG